MPESRVVFEEAAVLKSIVDAIDVLVGEATIKMDPEEGLLLYALDTSKTAAIILNLPRSYFIEIEIPEKGFYGINFSDLSRILKRAKAKERVELTLGENTLRVVIMDGYKREFELSLLAGQEFEVRTPPIEFKAKARLDSEVIPNAIKSLSLVGSDMEILIDGEKVEMTTTGERGKARVVVTKEDRDLIDVWAEEPSKSLYSMSYLEKMSKPAKIAEEAVLELSTNMPLKLTYPLGGIEGAGITYYLANILV